MIRQEELQSRLADARDIDRNNQHRDFIQLASNDAVVSSLTNFSQDANWISSSKMLYEWRHNEPFQGTDEEAAKFGADYMTDFYDLFRNPDTPFWVSPAQNVVNTLADFDDASPAQQMAFYYLQETYNMNDPVRAGVDQISSSASRDSDMTYQSLMEHNPKNVAKDGVNAYVRNRVMDHLDFDEIELAQATRANNVARENVEKVHGRDMEAERQAVREFGSDIAGFGNSLVRVLVGGGRDAVQGVFDLGADIDGTVPLGKIAWGYGNGLEWVKPDDPRYNSMTITVPDVPHGGGAAEEFGRSITQFLTVFATGGGFIRLGGSGAMKMADIGTDIAAGMMADATFDPELGNIATMLREFNVDNELVRFLDSQVGEDALPRERLIARMKTAGVEGTVLGLAVHGFIEALSGIKRAGLVPQLKQWMETGTTKLDEWLPAPGELRMGIGPSDKKKVSVRGHGLPSELLIEGSGDKATQLVVQGWGPNRGTTLERIDNLKSQHLNVFEDEDSWKQLWQEAAGGDVLPAPPYTLMNYINNPSSLAEKLSQLPPEYKAAVDEGFNHMRSIDALYRSGEAAPEDTAGMLAWAFLSRGAGPFQQESAFIDLIDFMTPYLEKAARGEFTNADLKSWKKLASKEVPAGSGASQVIHNINALGTFLLKTGQSLDTEGGRSVIEVMHEMLLSGAPTAEIRRKFFQIASATGIDNKVLSFALLPRGDVVVLDRIQARHLWDDGRYEGANIYDGIQKTTASGNTTGEGLNSLLAGPRGLMLYEMIEEQVGASVKEAYELIGRADDASISRFHWETWVIDGNQAVEHGSLRTIYEQNAPGTAKVTEGKPGTFTSGVTYMRLGDETLHLYPSSSGALFEFSPAQFKEFISYVKTPKNGIIPSGFKVSKNAEGQPRTTPWYEDPAVDRDKLDAAVKQFGEEWEGPSIGSSGGPVETPPADLKRQDWKVFLKNRAATAAGVATISAVEAASAVDMVRLAEAETNNDPTAVSEDGARGHIQMMPKTYADLEGEAADFGVSFPEELKGVSFEEAVANPELLELAGETYMQILALQLQNLDIPVNEQNLIGAWNMGADGYFIALATGKIPQETIGLWKRYGIEIDPTGFDVSSEGSKNVWKRWIDLGSKADQERRLKNAGIDTSVMN